MISIKKYKRRINQNNNGLSVDTCIRHGTLTAFDLRLYKMDDGWREMEFRGKLCNLLSTT